jgi:hypothetical protein
MTVLKEGWGLTAPKPVRVVIPATQMRHLRALAAERDGRRRYDRARSRWRQGLTDHATLKGMLGEQAFANYANAHLRLLTPLEVDAEDRPAGDGGIDFALFGVLIQVKTRTTLNPVLYRRATEDGRVLPINWHVLVSATYAPPPAPALPLGFLPEPFSGEQEVLLDGWTDRTAILDRSAFRDARIGRHKNLELTDACLEPMSDLVRHLENVRDARELP